MNAIIAAVPDRRGAILERLRTVIHAAEPEIIEAAKWRKPSSPLGFATFERHGVVCITIPLKERLRIMFPDVSRLPNPK